MIRKVCTKFPIFDRVTGADIDVRRLVFCIPSTRISRSKCQGQQQATHHVAHQIARAAALYQVEKLSYTTLQRRGKKK